MRKTRLHIRKNLMFSILGLLAPHFLKKWYWKIATFGSIHIVMGSKMFISPDQRALLGQYEPGVVTLMLELLREGMTFCDAGANIGAFTLLAAKLVGPEGRVIAFEPIPENAEVLRRNVGLNGYQNVEIIQKAVSNKSGIAQMYLSNWGGCHSLFPNPIHASGRLITVETVRLDSLPKMKQVDLLKIDVEGAEVAVLESLGEIRPNHVILEYNSERSEVAGISGPSFLQVIQDFGYVDIQNLDDRKVGLTPIRERAEVSLNLYLRCR